MKDIFIGNQRILILQGIEKNITLSNEMAQRLLRVYGHTLPLEKVNAIRKAQRKPLDYEAHKAWSGSGSRLR